MIPLGVVGGGAAVMVIYVAGSAAASWSRRPVGAAERVAAASRMRCSGTRASRGVCTAGVGADSEALLRCSNALAGYGACGPLGRGALGIRRRRGRAAIPGVRSRGCTRATADAATSPLEFALARLRRLVSIFLASVSFFTVSGGPLDVDQEAPYDILVNLTILIYFGA